MSTPATDPSGTGPAVGLDPADRRPGRPDAPDDDRGGAAGSDGQTLVEPGDAELRDLIDVPAAEVIAASCVHLMSAAAVKCGLTELGEQTLDLDEARKLITALAGLVTAARPDLGIHANALRDGLQALQAAFREASPDPDAPGEGPGEKLTGPSRR